MSRRHRLARLEREIARLGGAPRRIRLASLPAWGALTEADLFDRLNRIDPADASEPVEARVLAAGWDGATVESVAMLLDPALDLDLPPARDDEQAAANLQAVIAAHPRLMIGWPHLLDGRLAAGEAPEALAAELARAYPKSSKARRLAEAWGV